MTLWYYQNVVVIWWDEWCTDDDVMLRVIGRGGLLRAFSFDKGFRACLGDLPPDMPRRPVTWVSAMQFNAETPQSSGRIVLRVTIGRVTPSIPRERPTVIKHAIGGYLRLRRPTPAPALMWVLHWLRCWAEESGYATGNPPEDYGQIRGGCNSFRWLL